MRPTYETPLSEHPDKASSATLRELHQRGQATITVEEAARVLGVGRHAAYRAARSGELPTIRLGRRVRVPVPKLLALLGASPTTDPNEGRPHA